MTSSATSHAHLVVHEGVDLDGELLKVLHVKLPPPLVAHAHAELVHSDVPARRCKCSRANVRASASVVASVSVRAGVRVSVTVRGLESQSCRAREALLGPAIRS